MVHLMVSGFSSLLTEAEWFLQTLKVGEIVLRTTVVAAGDIRNVTSPFEAPKPKQRRRIWGGFFWLLGMFFFGE